MRIDFNVQTNFFFLLLFFMLSLFAVHDRSYCLMNKQLILVSVHFFHEGNGQFKQSCHKPFKLCEGWKTKYLRFTIYVIFTNTFYLVQFFPGKFSAFHTNVRRRLIVLIYRRTHPEKESFAFCQSPVEGRCSLAASHQVWPEHPSPRVERSPWTTDRHVGTLEAWSTDSRITDTHRGSFLNMSSAILNTTASLVSPAFPAPLSLGWTLSMVSRMPFAVLIWNQQLLYEESVHFCGHFLKGHFETRRKLIPRSFWFLHQTMLK